MLTKDIEIGDKKYHVVYSYQALFWFADFVKRKMTDLMDFLESEDMSEREGLALMYSGLVAGAERKNRRLDMSFFDAAVPYFRAVYVVRFARYAQSFAH